MDAVPMLEFDIVMVVDVGEWGRFNNTTYISDRAGRILLPSLNE